MELLLPLAVYPKFFYRPAAKLKHDYQQKNRQYNFVISYDFYPNMFSTFLKTKAFLG